MRCEGFRGVSQSLGHHIANDSVRDWVFDNKGGATQNADSEFDTTPYDVNVIGDYNIGGDAWASRILLEEIGLRVVGNWSGDATLAEIERAPKAKLNLIHCYRSMNYICRHMEEKYGVAWMEYNFFGPSQIEASLRKIAEHFGPEIEAKAEAMIAKYRLLVDTVIAKYRPRLEGKTVMLYVGGLRPRHVITAYEDLGMEIVGTGYEFGHGDDYQRTGHYVKDGTLIYDDVTGYELEKFIEKVRPDLVGSGIKEKYPVQKMGVPFRQMHSWDYSGPVSRLRRLRDFRPRHGPRHQQSRLGSDEGAVEDQVQARADRDRRRMTVRPAARPGATQHSSPATAAVWRCVARKESNHAAISRKDSRPRPALPRARIPGDARAQEGSIRMRRAARPGRGDIRLDQDLGIPREELRAHCVDGESGQGLPAARRGVRRRRVREDPLLRPRLAGLRRLLPLAPVAPFQGAVLGGFFLDDRGRGGVRRPQQHGRRPRQRLFAVQRRK